MHPRHPGDAADLPRFLSRAPTDAAITNVRDVLLVPTTYVEGDYLEFPPVREPPIDLGHGLSLGEAPGDDVELVMNACMPRGHYFIPVRQFGTRYAFVRQVDLAVFDESPFGWDADHVIYYAMVLSRLVRDNGYSLEFAARIVDHQDGQKQVIPVSAGTVATYRLRQDRDWLTTAEATQLRDLLAVFLDVRDELPWPVVHALNVSEDAVHLRIVQRALLRLATALEGFIHSNSSRVAQQFRERLPSVAAEVGVDGVTEEFARDLYDARSEAAHGAQVSMFRVESPPPPEGEPELPHAEPEEKEPEPDAMAMWAKAQELLRAAVRKAIDDPAFRDVFTSAETIRVRWPVTHDGRVI